MSTYEESIQEIEQLFQKIKSKALEIKEKESEKINKSIEKLSKEQDSIKSAIQTARSEFDKKINEGLSHLGQVIGKSNEIVQKIQNAFGDKFSTDMITKAQQMLTDKIHAAAGQLSEIVNSKLDQLEGKLDSTVKQALDSIGDFGNKINIDKKGKELFNQMQNALANVIATDPKSIFTPLAKLKENISEELGKISNISDTISGGLDVTLNKLASLPETLSVNFNNAISEFENIGADLKSAADVALLAQYELLNSGKFNSENVNKLFTKLTQISDNINNFQCIGTLKNIKGIKNILNFDQELNKHVDRFNEYAEAANKFLDNISELDISKKGNPLAKKFSNTVNTVRNEFKDILTKYKGVIDTIKKISEEDTAVYSSSRVSAYSKFKKAVNIPGGSVSSDTVRTPAVTQLSKLEAMTQSLPVIQNIKDICDAAKMNLDMLTRFNPADVLNPVSEIFDEVGKNAAESLKNIVNSVDIKTISKDITSDLKNIKKRLNSYINGTGIKSDIQGQINTLKPKIDQLKNSVDNMLNNIKSIEIPAKNSMNNIIKMCKNAGFDETLKLIQSGNYARIFTSSWENAALGTQLLADVVTLQQKFKEIKADARLIQDQAKALGNQIKISMKNMGNILDGFKTKTKRVLNQNKIRQTMQKRIDVIINTFESAVNQAKKSNNV